MFHKKNEFIVTPRIPLLIKNKDRILQLARNMKIEIGDWFVECPPKYKLDKSIIHSYKTGRWVSRRIINIPSYFTLEKKEILNLKKFIFEISLIENN